MSVGVDCVGEGVNVNVFVTVIKMVGVNVTLGVGDGVREEVSVNEGVRLAGWNGVKDNVGVTVEVGVPVAVGVSVTVGEIIFGAAVVAGVI